MKTHPPGARVSRAGKEEESDALGDLLKISGSNSTSACVRLSSTAFLNKPIQRRRGWMPSPVGGS